MYALPEETQRATQSILRSLFPAWLLPAFRVSIYDILWYLQDSSSSLLYLLDSQSIYAYVDHS